MSTALRGHGGTCTSAEFPELRQRSPLQRRRAGANTSVVRGARPEPVLRALAQSSPNRIVVNVVNLMVDRLGFEQVAVVATAALPESMARPAARLSIFHALEKCGRLSLDKG